tara:strand:+ start:332 stop:1054 length:723 start_codon:yes stop_codon:yes gene_type:complete
MNHSFNVDIATRLNSVEKAVLIENIAFWIIRNKANNKNFYDGEYWTYNSATAFSELFPYFKPSKIYKLLKSLESDGILKSGNYNKVAYDRTKWYTITDKSITKIYKIHFTNQQNGINQTVTPIPDINTNINTSIIKKEERFNFRKELLDFGFDENLINDWLDIRKKKKGSNSKSAFNIFVNRVKKSKYKPNQILETMVYKSWTSFEEDWIDNLQPKQNVKKSQDELLREKFSKMPSQLGL